MANRTLRQDDTTPELTGTASDAIGPVPLGQAVELWYTVTNADKTVSGAAVAVDPDATRTQDPVTLEWTFDPDCGRYRFEITDGDFDIVTKGMRGQLRVTWATGQVQRFPNEFKKSPTVDVDPKLDTP